MFSKLIRFVASALLAVNTIINDLLKIIIYYIVVIGLSTERVYVVKLFSVEEKNVFKFEIFKKHIFTNL